MYWTILRNLSAADVDLLLRSNDVFLAVSKAAPADIPAEIARQAPAIEALAAQLAAPALPIETPGPGLAAPTQPTQPPSSPVHAPAAAASKAEDGSVRVFVENLNRLTGFAGECLVEVKTLRPLGATLERLKQHQTVLGGAVELALEALRKESPVEVQARLEEALLRAQTIQQIIPAHMAEFERISRKLELVANRLYDEAVASRMRPFSDGLHGFPRMVRDLARSLGKQVHFEIEGQATHIDRDILEKLEAPLNHLLRNALDHGLETPPERAAAGKPEEGRLTLAARHVAGVLEIAVSDDGRGIDLPRLREKVVNQGYAAREMADSFSETELLDFLFLPGFSTAEKVSEVSGRGVGLDVVQSMVREVGGAPRIETSRGAGTAFLLQLPLTLSVVRTLLVEIHGEPYAIPLIRIDRVLKLAPGDVKVMEDRQYCRLGDQNIGLVDARQALGISDTERPPGDLSVIVLSDRLNRYGLVVDRLRGQRDLVVRPLGDRLGKVPNVSAGAILEDGTPVLILDAEDLVRSIDNLLTRGDLRKVGGGERASPVAHKRILVVDDSVTVREVERRLIRSVPGYEVAWTAADGAEAVERCLRDRPDLILMDLIMPVMDGVEATRAIITNAPCAILVVTAAGSGNASKVFEAMGYGALDAVATPVFGVGGQIDGGGELLRKIAIIGRLISTTASRPALEVPAPRPLSGELPALVSLGASTGGPKALAAVLRGLPPTLNAGVVVIQHLDVQFAAGLVDWLNEQTELPVTLAGEGIAPSAGKVYVAGTNDHLVLGADRCFRYTAEPADYPYRPSVDEFFLSLARHWPRPGVGVVLTGMGRDGARGLLALRQAGWRTIAQDQKTCTVYGMPKAAWEAGAATLVEPLERVAPAILEHFTKANP